MPFCATTKIKRRQFVRLTQSNTVSDYNTEASQSQNVSVSDVSSKDAQKALAGSTVAEKQGFIDTCSIFCRSYEMLTSGVRQVQCYRRCLPMQVCEQDMVVEQMFCNSNEQIAKGNSKLVGCAMKCCQTDGCNLNMLLEPDMYENDCVNHVERGDFECQAGHDKTKRQRCRGIGDNTLLSPVDGMTECKGGFGWYACSLSSRAWRSSWQLACLSAAACLRAPSDELSHTIHTSPTSHCTNL